MPGYFCISDRNCHRIMVLGAGCRYLKIDCHALIPINRDFGLAMTVQRFVRARGRTPTTHGFLGWRTGTYTNHCLEPFPPPPSGVDDSLSAGLADLRMKTSGSPFGIKSLRALRYFAKLSLSGRDPDLR